MRKASKGTIAFRIIYFTFVILIIGAIALGLRYLWRFLEDYQATLPENIVDKFVDRLENGDYTDIYNSVEFHQTPFEGRDALEKIIDGKLEGEYKYSKLQQESTEEAPVYKIKCGWEQVALLKLKQTGKKSDFGFPIYQTDEVTSFEIVPQSVIVNAMNNYTVTVNGVELDSTYIVAENQPPDEVKYFHDYLNDPPKMVSYKVDGLLSDPEILAFDKNGAPVKMSEHNIFPLSPSENEELKQMGLEFSKLYTKYIANDATFNDVAAYIPSDLPLYEDLYYYEGNFYSWHSDYAFSEEWAGDLYKYSDDCFSVRAKYTHSIWVWGEQYDFPVDNTIYFVSDGENWLVTDVMMNFETEGTETQVIE